MLRRCINGCLTRLPFTKNNDEIGEDDSMENDSDRDGVESSISYESSEDDINERGFWTKQIEFILSCIGYAVGLGNLWRFPYLCMRNGGGAFLIPYFTFLILCGIPLFFLELSLGQFASLSPLCIWKISPLFKGMGWAMVMVSGICCVYYNIIITWVLYYLFKSFASTLPWATCDNWWNTDECTTHRGGVSDAGNLTQGALTSTNLTFMSVNGSAVMFGGNVTHTITQNISETLHNASSLVGSKPVSAAEEFWHHNVLQISEGIHEIGILRWELVLFLILSWLIIFLCLFGGVKTSGKVVYVTATVPYIFLTILLIRGALLPGAHKGIIWYVTPDWARLADFKVWAEACIQIFYSLGPAWGGLITMASYNKFDHNLYRDAVMVPIVNCGTSFYAGFVVFSVIGFMADQAGVEVEDVITQGPGLAFIAYPEGLAQLPISPLWSAFFFIMILSVGLDTQFGMFETMVSGFVDQWPQYLKKYKVLFTAFCCTIALLLGLPLVTKGGIYIFTIVDWYLGCFTLMFVSLLECIVVGYCYGADRLYCDIEMMIGYKPSPWWKICWKYITPSLLLSALVFSLFVQTAPVYGDYIFPGWAIGIGWVIALISTAPIPIGAVHQLYISEGTFMERIKKSAYPQEDWGPALEKYRALYKYNVQKVPLSDAGTTPDSPNSEEDCCNSQEMKVVVPECSIAMPLEDEKARESLLSENTKL